MTRSSGCSKPRRVRSLLIIAAASALPLACAHVPLLNASQTFTSLQPEDFAPDVQTDASSAPAHGVSAEPAPQPAPAPVLSVTAGPPEISQTPADPIEQPVLVESKVGDVNGKPIFADEFLKPMAARLAAEAKRMPRAQWVSFANEQINRRLSEIITDELLRAEALSRLTPEQKQGLRGFLQSIRKDLASKAAGSRTLAAQRLEQQEGMTEEEYIRSQEQATLIYTTLIKDINNRVNISWRDIEQRYQRDYPLYNPPPTAVFRLIRIPTEDADAIAFVNDELAKHRPFAEVAAESASNYKREVEGLDEIPFQEDFKDASFFGGQILNDQAHSLSVGEWTGPFELGPYTGWLALEDIRTKRTSLYEAQLDIYSQLLEQRRHDELQRYLDRLQERASFTSLDEMREKLFLIADERYGQPNGPTTP